MARVVLGLPMYRSEEFVAEVIESLLSLDFADLAVVAVDDCSPDDTVAIARSLAAEDPRLIVEANPQRLGMIANWNRVLERAYELFPEFEFFAWASDNDIREPSWLPELVRALESDSRAAFAYSRFGVIEDGRKIARPERWRFDSRDIDDPFRRLKATRNGMRAGAMMYGLHRRRTLEQVGDVPPVLLSDVLFLSHLSLYGTFLQVPEVLWYRGARRTGGSMRRQRASLFGEQPPRMTFLPVSLQHTLWLLRRMASKTTRPPGTSLGRGMQITFFYLTNWWVRLLQRAVGKNRKRLARLRKRLARTQLRTQSRRKRKRR